MIGLPLFILPQFIVCFLPLLRRLSGKELLEEQIIKLSLFGNTSSVLLLIYSYFFSASYEDIFLNNSLINTLVLLLLLLPTGFWFVTLRQKQSFEEKHNIELFNIVLLLSCLLLLTNQVLLMVCILPLLLIGVKLNEYAESYKRLSMVASVALLMSLCMIIAFFEFIRSGNYQMFTEISKRIGGDFPRLGVAMLSIALSPLFLYPVSKLLGDENQESNWSKEVLFGIFPSLTAICVFLKVSLLSGIYIKNFEEIFNIENFFFICLVLSSAVSFYKLIRAQSLKKIFNLWFIISSIHFLCNWMAGLGVSEAVGFETNKTWTISIVNLSLLIFSSLSVFLNLKFLNLKTSEKSSNLQIKSQTNKLCSILVFNLSVILGSSIASVGSLNLLANTFRVMLSSEMGVQASIYFFGQIITTSLQACACFYLVHESLRDIQINKLERQMMNIKSNAGYLFVIIVLILLGIYPSPLYNYIQNIIIN